MEKPSEKEIVENGSISSESTFLIANTIAGTIY